MPCPEKYCEYQKKRLQQIAAGEYDVYVHPCCSRLVNKAICIPVRCSPCLVWSCALRILCVPVQGCSALCTGTKGTLCCDAMVHASCEDVDRTISDWGSHNIDAMSVQQLRDIIVEFCAFIKQLPHVNLKPSAVCYYRNFIAPIYNQYASQNSKTAYHLNGTDITILLCQLETIVDQTK